MSYDAIVVGAGINGLAAAVHLSAKGWKVAVVERAAVAGGAVKTGEITLPGFRHDLYAMNLSLFVGSPFFAVHRDRLIKQGLQLVPARDCFASVFPDQTWLGIGNDLQRNLDVIARASPSDAQRWRELVGAFAGDASHIFALLSSPMPSWAMARVLWRAWREKGTGWLADLARLIVASPRNWLDENFSDERLKVALAAWGMHLDFAPDVAGGALFPYLESMANQSFGMAIGKTGADAIVSAMVGAIKEAGGDVLLNKPVIQILTSAGAASGVELAGGERLSAARAIVANVHPKLLFGDLLRGLGQQSPELAKLQRLRPGPATMMVHFALSDLPTWSAGAELKKFAYVHIAPSFSFMARAYNEALAGLLPVEPVLVVGQPTAIDDSRSPNGRHILWVQVRVLPFQIHADALGQIQGKDWDGVKEAYADRVEALIESYAPAFRELKLGRCVLSPLDLQRDNPNLVGGDSLSGSHHLDQNFFFRPAFGWSRYRTPIDKLFMVGASNWPGAGTGAGSGFLLAKMLVGV
jgi:phytoene dehydrogenase-like protein